MMDVSVIFVNYNTLELTRAAIDSVLKFTYDVVYEVIVVDNASTDGSKEYFEKRKDIIYIYNNENVGFGCANNIGYRHSKGKYIFLLNTDTYLLNNAIKEFHDYMEHRDSSVACVGCWLKDDNLNENASVVHFLHINTILKNSVYSILPFLKPKNLSNGKEINHKLETFVEAVIGADMFIRREVIEKHGLFDENIFMYCEEIDCQKRWKDAGYKMVIITTPSIVHLEGQSSKKYTAWRNIMFTRSVFYYLKKHNSRWKYVAFRMLFAILKLPMILNKNYTFGDRVKIIGNTFLY